MVNRYLIGFDSLCTNWVIKFDVNSVYVHSCKTFGLKIFYIKIIVHIQPIFFIEDNISIFFNNISDTNC